MGKRFAALAFSALTGCASAGIGDIERGNLVSLDDTQLAFMFAATSGETSDPTTRLFAYKAALVRGVTHVCGWLQAAIANGGKTGSQAYIGYFLNDGFVVSKIARRQEADSVLSACTRVGIRIL